MNNVLPDIKCTIHLKQEVFLWGWGVWQRDTEMSVYNLIPRTWKDRDQTKNPYYTRQVAYLLHHSCCATYSRYNAMVFIKEWLPIQHILCCEPSLKSHRNWGLFQHCLNHRCVPYMYPIFSDAWLLIYPQVFPTFVFNVLRLFAEWSLMHSANSQRPSWKAFWEKLKVY